MKDWLEWTLEPFANAGRTGLFLFILAIPSSLAGSTFLVWGAVAWTVGWHSLVRVYPYYLVFGWLVGVLLCAVPFRVVAAIVASRRYKNRKRRGLED